MQTHMTSHQSNNKVSPNPTHKDAFVYSQNAKAVAKTTAHNCSPSRFSVARDKDNRAIPKTLRITFAKHIVYKNDILLQPLKQCRWQEPICNLEKKGNKERKKENRAHAAVLNSLSVYPRPYSNPNTPWRSRSLYWGLPIHYSCNWQPMTQAIKT